MNYKDQLNKLLDQWIISEEEHKKGMEADSTTYKELDTWEYPGDKN